MSVQLTKIEGLDIYDPGGQKCQVIISQDQIAKPTGSGVRGLRLAYT